MMTLHAAPGQRLRAHVLERHGHPLVRLEVEGAAEDLAALHLAARLARREPWASGGAVDVLTALAGARPGDRYFDRWRWLSAVEGFDGTVLRTVHRLRRGRLRCVGVIVERWCDAHRAVQIGRQRAPHQWREPRFAVRLQRPVTRRSGRIALELRLAPGSRVRLRCERPANQNGGAA